MINFNNTKRTVYKNGKSYTLLPVEELCDTIKLTIEQKVTKLIKKCNVRGGTDNISIAYLETESGDEE